MEHGLAILEQYGLIGMFVMVAVENMGIPFPTEPAYLVGQAFIIKGVYPSWVVLLTLYLGHTVGSTISYFAGRRIASDFMKKREDLTDTQKKIASWYEKYGVATVLGTRLIGYVRPWSSYVAGIAEVNFWQFFILTSIGTVLLNAITLAFSHTFLVIWHNYPFLRGIIALSLATGFILLFWQGYVKRKSRSLLKS